MPTTLDLRARYGRSAGRRFLFEWLATGIFGVAVLVLAALLPVTASLDHVVYDSYLRLNARTPSADIVMVEIDNASIAQLGRWPWPRSVHTRLAETLAKAHPAAVIYDVLFTEPSPDDQALARAFADAPTFLPVLLSPADETGMREALRPVAPLAAAAAGLGHINLEVDSDGIVRSVALFEGDAHSRWPQLMVPVWRAIRSGRLPLADGSEAAQRAPDITRVGGTGSEARFLVPFSRAAQHYRKVSFAQVLAGTVPPEWFRGRIVIVGATASGLYDRFAIPLSGALGPLPGAYIHANVLDTLLRGDAIEPVSRPITIAASLVPLALLLAGFLVFSPVRSLILTAVLAVCALVFGGALLFGAHRWMTPVPAILALVSLYPAWSWRRLEMTMAYLRKELQQLADEPNLLPEAPRRRREFSGDVLERYMALMAQAAQRVQDMKRFVWDSLDSVPEPILVADRLGAVLIANQAARAHFARLGEGPPEGRLMRDALADLAFVKTIDASPEADTFARAHWPAPLDPTRAEYATLMEEGVEVRDREERDHLLRYAKCTNAEGEQTGWIAGLVDVTALHEAERQREDALRLLSHDMRSPQASILALVEIERARNESPQVQGLMQRIERYARRALELADDFVQLARAESQPYDLRAASLGELVIDASDEVWPQAHAKHIQIDHAFEDDGEAWVCADRSLITRSLVNILNNAVKYSPGNTHITCTVALEPATSADRRVVCTIRDQGYGIPLAEQAYLFERFRRFHADDRPEVNGTGLGMAFVKTVVMRHGGDVTVQSEPGKGTAFTISLPLFLEEADDALPDDAGNEHAHGEKPDAHAG